MELGFEFKWFSFGILFLNIVSFFYIGKMGLCEIKIDICEGVFLLIILFDFK